MDVDLGKVKMQVIEREDILEPISSDSSESEWEDAKDAWNCELVRKIDEFLAAERAKVENARKKLKKADEIKKEEDKQKQTANKTEKFKHTFEAGYCHIRVRLNSWSKSEVEKKKLQDFALKYGKWQHLWVMQHDGNRMIGYINFNHPFAALRCRKDRKRIYEILQ